MLRKKVSGLEKRRCLCVDRFSENVYVCVLNRNRWHWGLPGGSDGKEPACNAGDLNSSPGSGDPMEEGMATHSSILAWETSWTEEHGGLQSVGSQRVGQDRVSKHTH